MEHFQHAVIAFVDQYGYVGLFVALVLGNAGAPVGAEIVLPAAGALAATGHLSSVWIAIAVALAGELAGGSVGYAIGRYGGLPLIERYGKYIHITHDRVVVVHRFFERWGTFAIFICRFIPFVRGVSPIAAGIAEMQLWPFYIWTFFGSLIMCSALVLLGNALGAHLDSVIPLLHRGAYAVLAAVIVVTTIAICIVRARLQRSQRVPG